MTPLIIAHRGGAGLWPENTLFAFRNAVRHGFAAAELDVQLTRDGKLVVFHDFRLKADVCRKNGSWLAAPGPLICELPFAEIRMYDVGRPRPDSDYARAHPDLAPCDGERIPLFGEVIAAVKAKEDFRLFVEIKTNFKDRSQSAPPEAVAEAAISELAQMNFLNRAIVVGFDWVALRHVRRISPATECWFTTEPQHQRHESIRQILQTIRSAGGKGWSPSRFDASAANIRAAHDVGLKVAAYTVNEPAEMRRLAAANIDAVFTDRPDVLSALTDNYSA